MLILRPDSTLTSVSAWRAKRTFTGTWTSIGSLKNRNGYFVSVIFLTYFKKQPYVILGSSNLGKLQITLYFSGLKSIEMNWLQACVIVFEMKMNMYIVLLRNYFLFQGKLGRTLKYLLLSRKVLNKKENPESYLIELNGHSR